MEACGRRSSAPSAQGDLNPSLQFELLASLGWREIVNTSICPFVPRFCHLALYHDCYHDSGTHDSGTHDSGTHDSGTHDSGTHDSGTHDSGTHDSGTHDSGTHDSGTHGCRTK